MEQTRFRLLVASPTSPPRKNRALEFRADAGGHYSRVKRLSSIATGWKLKFYLVSTLWLTYLLTPLLTSRALAQLVENAAVAGGGHQNAHTGSTAPTSSQNPRELFTEGETALRNGDLSQAEGAFRRVLALNPKVAGAYANLGVIYMRHKQWHQALEMLRTAERLAPTVSGVRLNIGLVYYRQNDFRSPIEPFETVVRDQPDSGQGRYLLGLCYFFMERWADAAKMLEPLWPQESNHLNYLYVLGIAAGNSHNTELEDRALGRLVEVTYGQGSSQPAGV